MLVKLPKTFLAKKFTGTGIVCCYTGVKLNGLWKNLLVPRTREGYYHYTGGVEVSCFCGMIRDPPLIQLGQAAIKRAKVYASHADLLWVGTSTPTVSVAKHCSGKIKEAYPEKWFVYT